MEGGDVTDTACQRDGYDAKTQRYRVPVSSTAPVSQTGNAPDTGNGHDDSDQCPSCRCAPNMPHAFGCEAANSHDDEPVCTVAAPETPGTPHIPFPTQSWMFEALAEVELDKLHEILDKFQARIIKTARIRHQDGFVTHGSEMYSWTPERRLDEMLQEIADSIAYLTSGPIA